MFNLFGKKKVKASELAPAYTYHIYQAMEQGFPEIAGYLNEDPNFVKPPGINLESDEWFIYIVFAGNLLNLENHFAHEQVPDLTRIFAQQFTEMLGKDPLTDTEIIYDYINYLNTINEELKSIPKSMAVAIFRKYDLGKFQSEDSARSNEPGAEMLKDLSDMIMYFLWNWEDYLSKYKVTNE